MKTLHYVCILSLAMMFLQPLSLRANDLTNGSFEDGITSWNVTGFGLASSVPDMGGVEHFPTDGLSMMQVTNGYGVLVQNFVSADKQYFLTFDRNLIDPSLFWIEPMPDWPLNDLDAMGYQIRLHDSNGNFITYTSTLPTPVMANSWETVTVTFPVHPVVKPDLNIGEEYRLTMSVEPYYIECVVAPCPQVYVSATSLIDNVVLTPTSEYRCYTNEDCLIAELYCEKAPGDCNGEGTCQLKPVSCTYEWDPVCGCDGNTYGNACEASGNSVSIDHIGECCETTSGTGICDTPGLCKTGSGTCVGGVCAYSPVVCPTGATCDPNGMGFCMCTAVENNTATIRGGGGKPTGTDLEVQTTFTGLSGCLVDYTTSTITVSSGAVLQVDYQGSGPHPSAIWMDSQRFVGKIINCPEVTAETKMILKVTNKAQTDTPTDQPVGKDTDRMTIKVVP